MEYPCDIVDQPDRPTVAIRTRSTVQDLPQTLGRAYGAVLAHMNAVGAAPSSAPFVVYYNMDMEDLDLEIGFCVLQAVPPAGEVLSSHIPAGREATCLFTGPYPELGPAYETLSRWVKEKGLEPTGVVSEWYLNDPAVTPPAGLQTLIVFPLK